MDRTNDTSSDVIQRSFPHPDHLYLYLAPLSEEDEKATFNALQEIILSWVPAGDSRPDHGSEGSSQRYLCLLPWRRDQFKRDAFIALLRMVGPVIEAALCSSQDPEDTALDRNAAEKKDDDQTDPCRATLSVRDLADRVEWDGWWKVQIAGCFPTLYKWNRLYVEPTDKADGELARSLSWRSDREVVMDDASCSQTTDTNGKITT